MAQYGNCAIMGTELGINDWHFHHKEKIKEASQYIPLENLAISPQCGFASSEEGNVLTEEDQWNKIKHAIKIAERVWDQISTNK